MDSLVEDLNTVIPDYQVTSDDLLKPKPMFFMEAMLKLLESLEVQIEASLLKYKPPMSNEENMEAFNDILPLLNLTEAINSLGTEIHEDFDITTIADLIMPTKSTVENIFRVFHNFILFVQDRKDSIVEREEEIEEKVQQLNRMIMEKDKYKIEIDTQLLDNMKMDEEIVKKNNDIYKHEEHFIEQEKEINELVGEYEFIKMENEAINADLEKQRHIQLELLEKTARLKSQIVTETERSEVIARKDAILQREEVVQQETDDINNMIWKKEDNIKTLDQNIIYMSECETMFDVLDDLYHKIKEIKNTNMSNNGEEKELCNYQKNVVNLEKKVAELRKRDELLSEELNKINLSAEDELNKLSKEEEMHLKDLKKYKTTTTEYQNKINHLQSATLEHYNEYNEITNLYTEEIPLQYDNMIEDYVSRIKNNMDGLKRFLKK